MSSGFLLFIHNFSLQISEEPQIKSTAYKQKQHDDNCGRHLIWLTAYLL